jgi:hypothetical protein
MDGGGEWEEERVGEREGEGRRRGRVCWGGGGDALTHLDYVPSVNKVDILKAAIVTYGVGRSRCGAP